MLLFRRRSTTALHLRSPFLPLPLPLSTSPAPAPAAGSLVFPLTKSQLKALVLSTYRHGKFNNLIRNVVASPSLLLTAVHNLSPPHPNPSDQLTLDLVSSRFFSIWQIASELCSDHFDLSSCIIKGNRSKQIAVLQFGFAMGDDANRSFLFFGQRDCGRGFLLSCGAFGTELNNSSGYFVSLKRIRYYDFAKKALRFLFPETIP